MSLEVVAQLSGSDEYCIKQLMDLQVPRLGHVEDLADVVHRSLDGPDPPGVVWPIYFHGLKLRELSILWIQRDL
jgi:hypothetical protein